MDPRESGGKELTAFGMPIYTLILRIMAWSNREKTPHTGAPTSRWKRKTSLCIQCSGLSAAAWGTDFCLTWPRALSILDPRFGICWKLRWTVCNSCSSAGRCQGEKEIRKGRTAPGLLDTGVSYPAQSWYTKTGGDDFFICPNFSKNINKICNLIGKYCLIKTEKYILICLFKRSVELWVAW